jgi:ribosomal protein S18 acetylase RimI-like enzyme
MDDSTIARLAHLQAAGFWGEHARWSRRGEMAEIDGLLFYATGSRLAATFNGCFRLDDSVPGDETIARASRWFGERGRGFTVHVRIEPDADADLRQACFDAGLEQVGDPEPEMVCMAPVESPQLPDGVVMRQIVTVADVADFVHVGGEAYADYGMPKKEAAQAFDAPQRFLDSPTIVGFVARDDQGPLAAALTYVGAGIAGIYWVGTVRRARGQGLGEAVAAATTNAGFELGGRFSTLQASRMGVSIYRRMGYREIYSVAQMVYWA